MLTRAVLTNRTGADAARRLGSGRDQSREGGWRGRHSSVCVCSFSLSSCLLTFVVNREPSQRPSHRTPPNSSSFSLSRWGRKTQTPDRRLVDPPSRVGLLPPVQSGEAEYRAGLQEGRGEGGVEGVGEEGGCFGMFPLPSCDHSWAVKLTICPAGRELRTRCVFRLSPL
jgi:hypothetical protein